MPCHDEQATLLHIGEVSRDGRLRQACLLLDVGSAHPIPEMFYSFMRWKVLFWCFQPLQYLQTGSIGK